MIVQDETNTIQFESKLQVGNIRSPVKWWLLIITAKCYILVESRRLSITESIKVYKQVGNTTLKTNALSSPGHLLYYYIYNVISILTSQVFLYFN